MFEVINQLKQEKRRLTSSFNQHKNTYQTKISRIDRAITNFEKGLQELGEDASQRRPSRADQIGEILRRQRRPMHLKQILKELSRTGSEPPYQSLSRLMQAHTNKRFTRTGPATFALVAYDKGKNVGRRRK